MKSSSHIPTELLPVTTPEEDVVILSDSDHGDVPNNPKTPTNSANSENHSTEVIDANSDDDEDSDILFEVIQLIDWINSYEKNFPKSEKISPKKKFMNGFLFIENLQTQFEENERIKTEMDNRIAVMLEENLNLKNQFKSQQQELEKMVRRNVKLEMERKQKRKEGGGSIGRLRSKMESLQDFFAVVIDKLEKEPINYNDVQSVQKRQDVEVFKIEVNDLFGKVQRRLKVWDINQMEMEAELESTKLVIDKLNEMVISTEKIPSSPSSSASSRVQASQFFKDAAETDNRNKVPPVSTGNAQPPKSKKSSPPELLPLNLLPPPIPSSQGKTMQGQQFDMDSLLTCMSTLQPNSPKSVMNAPASFEQRSRTSPSPNFSTELPPLPKLNFPLPSVQQPRGFHTSLLRKLPFLKQPLTSIAATPSTSSSKQLTSYRPTLPKSTISNNTHHRDLLSRVNIDSNSIPGTRHSIPPVQLPVTHQMTLPPSQSTVSTIPAGRQIEAVGTFGEPTTEKANKPLQRQNICGLCGMSFNKLIQMKLHHTVVHSKEPVQGCAPPPAPAQQNLIRSLAYPPPPQFCQQTSANLGGTTSMQQQATVTREGCVEPMQKRLCLGQSNPIFSLASTPSATTLPQELPVTIGQQTCSEINYFNADNLNSNENSIYYPFL